MQFAIPATKRKKRRLCIAAKGRIWYNAPRSGGKFQPALGGMAEWTKAPVLKTGMEQSIVGSNPTPSALTTETGEVPEWTIGAAC